VTPHGTSSASELFELALAQFEQGAFLDSARRFDRVARLDPGGPLAGEALFRAGVAYDQAGDSPEHRQQALDHFEKVARAYPGHPLARPALIRATRLLVFLERWQRASSLASTLLGTRPGPRPLEEALVRAAIALAHIEQGRLGEADLQIEKARTVIEQEGLNAAGRIPRDVAALFFALGELRRRRAEAITFRPLPHSFPDVLEQRAQLILDAQAAYSDTMRAEDAHWSAMAGHQLGRLYERLHEDLMAISPPPEADTEERRRLFEGAMRLRYSVLVDKALTMMEHVVEMAERTAEDSSWIELARDAKVRLAAARRREEQVLERLPYTREQLRRALGRLAKESGSRSGSGPVGEVPQGASAARQKSCPGLCPRPSKE
jgi:tetratricopeptide (TPR) repeat protein